MHIFFLFFWGRGFGLIWGFRASCDFAGHQYFKI